jgi:hypothetical protein
MGGVRFVENVCRYSDCKKSYIQIIYIKLYFYSQKMNENTLGTIFWYKTCIGAYDNKLCLSIWMCDLNLLKGQQQYLGCVANFRVPVESVWLTSEASKGLSIRRQSTMLRRLVVLF